MNKVFQYALLGALIGGSIVVLVSAILIGDVAWGVFASLIYGPIGLILGAIGGGIFGLIKSDISKHQSLKDVKEQLSLNSRKEDLDNVGLLLVQLIDNVHPYMRIEAIEKVARIKIEPRIIDALKYAASQDADTVVRLSAKNALAELSNK